VSGADVKVVQGAAAATAARARPLKVYGHLWLDTDVSTTAVERGQILEDSVVLIASCFRTSRSNVETCDADLAADPGPVMTAEIVPFPAGLGSSWPGSG